jgi:hypothetical protein
MSDSEHDWKATKVEWIGEPTCRRESAVGGVAAVDYEVGCVSWRRLIMR